MTNPTPAEIVAHLGRVAPTLPLTVAARIANRTATYSAARREARAWINTHRATTPDLPAYAYRGADPTAMAALARCPR